MSNTKPFEIPSQMQRGPDGHREESGTWKPKKKPEEVSQKDFRDDVRYFVDMSYHLTGFDRADLFGTGSSEEYLDTLINRVGLFHAHDLYRAVCAVDPEPGADRIPDKSDEPILHALAVATTMMWYLGSWKKMNEAIYAKVIEKHTPRKEKDKELWFPLPPNETKIISPNAYLNGLVWQLSGGHALGGKPTGFGTWAEEPVPVHKTREERQKYLSSLQEQMGNGRS